MFKKLSIQSKLTILLLTVSVSSILIIAFIGYRSGKQALNNSINNQLTSVRFTTSEQIETYFEKVNLQVEVMSQNPATLAAMKEFQQAYGKLEQLPPQRSWKTAIHKYYREQFIPALKPNVQGEPVASTYEPDTTANQYLQFHYGIKSIDFDEKAAVNNAQDGSEYSTVHARYHPHFRKFTDAFQHEDLFLIDPKTGNVIYSVFKATDFASNLKTGALQRSVLAEAFNQVIKEQTPGFIAMVDYAPYRPSYDAPAAMIASAIFEQGELIGVLAMQISADPINEITTYRKQWKSAGLGDSGETYLVGPDYLMRSNSRFFLESPKHYYEMLIAAGVPDENIDRIKRLKTSILTQKVMTEAALLALEGKQGTQLIEDYRKVKVLSSYAPLKVRGLNWSIIAEIDEKEAFRPIGQFQKQVFISTSIIVLGITIIALIISYYWVRPIQLLSEGFKALGQGKMDTKINLQSQDEFQDLAHAFNDMVQSLQQKNNLIQQQNQENERLILSILPGPVAKRLKQGEENIADDFPNVTILFADLVGFAHLCDQKKARETLDMLNQLVTLFDESTERFGVEKIKTIGSGYMAVGGLSIQRIDHVKRILDFAVEMIRIVQRFNQTHHTDLKLQIGVHSGPVVAGIVGKSKFIYDLWGDTVNTAHGMKTSANINSIHVTEVIYQQMKEFYPFEGHGTTERGENRGLKTWQLAVE